MSTQTPVALVAEGYDPGQGLSTRQPTTIYTDPTDGAKLVTPADAARLVRKSPRTIYRWIEQGGLRTRQTPSGQVFVEVASVFAGQTQEPPVVRGAVGAAPTQGEP